MTDVDPATLRRRWVHSHEEDTGQQTGLQTGVIRLPTVAWAECARSSLGRELRGERAG